MTASSQELPIAGLTPFTTIDYPGSLAAVIFCQGCPWRCPYCHNAQLRPFTEGKMPWTSVLEFLGKRKGWIEAVVFSGGEPTAHSSLLHSIQEVRKMGYKIGLHTAGTFPDRLCEVLPFVDWVGLDIKAPFGPLYDKLTGAKASAHLAFESLLHLLSSRKPHQLRTTFDPGILTSEDIEDINHTLAAWNAPLVAVQTLRPYEKPENQLLS